MIRLQGSWRRGTGFFLWGRDWSGTVTAPAELAFALTPFLGKEKLNFGAEAWRLPVDFGEPTEKEVWQTLEISGLWLAPAQTGLFFQSLPLGALDPGLNLSLGGEIRFFAHLYRWGLDLLVRGKALPGLQERRAVWLPLLDSIRDQTRLAQFAQTLPGVALAPEFNQGVGAWELILDFLQTQVQTQIQLWGKTLPRPRDPWLKVLLAGQGEPLEANRETQRLETALYHWLLPVQADLGYPQNRQLETRQWRTVLILRAPTGPEEPWPLDYGLQALAQENQILGAETLWRSGHQAQDILLAGLGLAARLWEPIAESLEEPAPTGRALTTLQAYEFIQATASLFRDNGLGVILPAELKTQGAQTLGVALRAWITTAPGERLTLKHPVSYELGLTMGERPLSAGEFQTLLDQRSPLAALDGQWLLLQPAQVRAAQAILQSSLEPPPLSVDGALQLAAGETQTFAKLPLKGFKAEGILLELIQTLQDPQGVKPIPNPPGFQGQLRPYQAKGVGWLAFMERWGLGACLADDMGLGKTPQLLGFLLTLQAEDAYQKPVLIVCPTSVLSNWRHEIAKFAPSLKTLLHHGDKRKQGQPLAKQVKNHEVVLTSYALLQRDLKSLQLTEWQGLVLDEAQNVKNPQTQQAQAARQLKAGFRVALTGTPVENRLGELWSILDFLNPGFLGSQSFFQKRFALPIEKYGDRASRYRLQNLTRPFILRRLKTDPKIIHDLPEKQEMTVYCSLSARQAELYQELVNQSLPDLENSDGVRRSGQILALLTRLKQLCNHPAHLLKEKSLEPPQASGKLLRLEAMLEEVIAEGDRALIFTQFAEWGTLLQGYLRGKFKQDVLFLQGATPQKERTELIRRFQEDPDGPQLFILSLKAGGTGINLTRANHVFHVDRWWNPAVENQATDRAFRIGQTRNVQVHKFVSAGTVEEKIQTLLASKADLAEQTITSGENWLGKLDTQQLRSLLLLDQSAVVLGEAAEG
ncbi:MAG: DEAD/DEAH box helicase [Cyanobacteriota bacterium]|nr:DEAD/DEAH box helicase [Cyanobacteriota bacterium]